ncbi:MAG TPA: tetratricopeptide repeat protein [Blastocatellia bacterium]|jgi:tetratricopeptide (TPR) repeat protein|nr:tetratricopeptide repeat protein [Blastocatellia bacterium]
MSMHVETNNRKAFELVTEALMDIDRYKHTKQKEQLELAKDKLEEAQGEDPKYMRALYYSAMVNDLIGKAADAVEQFEKILEENPPFIEEVRYNLGVAYYHRYSWKYLDQAARHFQSVIDNTPDGDALNLLARAGLAQTYAMRMIQPNPREPNLEEAQKYFDLTRQQYELVSSGVEEANDLGAETLKEIRWATSNARGMSLMYHSDYFGDKYDKESELRESLVELNEADKYSPENWANYCDLGSAHMRLGHWLGSNRDFNEALRRLNKVVVSLRPNYGFALYEMGRTYRLKGEFQKAIEYFDRALSINERYRDVSDRRVDIEKERAEKEEKEYP